LVRGVGVAEVAVGDLNEVRNPALDNVVAISFDLLPGIPLKRMDLMGYPLA